MKVLVTGSTGLLGNNLVRMLLNEGHSVVCPVRRAAGKELADLAVQQVLTDFSPGQDWRPILEGCQAVIHSAAVIHLGWTRWDECRNINVHVTRDIAQAARQVGCRMIQISSVDTLAHSLDGTPADEDLAEPKCPPCNYVVTKTEAEQAIHQEIAQGLDALIVHPGFLIGGWDWKPSSGKLMLAIHRRQIPLAPAGGCCPVDVRDVARGLILALRKGRCGQHYILGGENLLYRDLFLRFEEVVGGRAPRWVMRPGVAKVAGWIGDSVTRILGRETDLNSAMVQMGQIRHWYTSDKAIRELGYSISPLQPAIQRAWDFIKKHHLNSGQA